MAIIAMKQVKYFWTVMIDWLKKNKEKLSGVVLLMFLIWFIAALLYVNIYEPSQLREHGRYTVAVTGELFFLAKGGRNIEYKYWVNGKQYEDDWGYMDYLVPEGEMYLIKFSSKDPSINERVYSKPVPKEYRNPPPEGWEKVPYYDHNLRFDKYR